MFESSNDDNERFRGDEDCRLNILISAFSCWPGKGSEAGVGWNWSTIAARHHNVWVLVWPENRPAIESELDRMDGPKPNFIYWKVPGWPERLLPIDEYMRIYYVLWQLTIMPRALWLHRKIRFDAVHHLTFNTIELPGFLWILDAPFYWGPIGGAQEPPRSLRHHFGGAWFGEVVRIIRKRIVPYNPLVTLPLRRARKVLAANADTERLLEQCGVQDAQRELETGIDTSAIEVVETSAERSCLTVLWAGKFFARKGPFLAISAIGEAKRRGVPVRMLVAGDGPLEATMREHIAVLALDSEIEFLGRLNHREMTEFYRQGDVLFFSSLHDTSGNVMLEAMAHGLPVLALDHHGAAEIVDEASGIKVQVADEKSVLAGFADGLAVLWENPERRRAMGLAARKRVEEEYSWERKDALIRDLYISDPVDHH
jgi:glycosyltransferase involved in cell wall biosynthesis